MPSDIQQSIDNVEWDDIGSLLLQVCYKLELRKPGEDRHLRDLLDGMWYESRIDTRSLPQPGHVLDLMKSKPVEAALDKQLRELQDGPVRDMLRLALHLGVRACKPGPDPGDPIDQVTAELDRIKMQARSTVSLCFSLLSEIHSSRREMMWKIQGAKASELRGRSIFEPEDRDIMARIVEKREWESKLLPKLAKTDPGRGRGGRKGGRGRGGGGRRRHQRGSSGADDSEGKSASENRQPAAAASSAAPAPAAAAAAKSTKSPRGTKKGGRGGRG